MCNFLAHSASLRTLCNTAFVYITGRFNTSPVLLFRFSYVSLTSQAMPIVSSTDAASAVGNVPVSLFPARTSTRVSESDWSTWKRVPRTVTGSPRETDMVKGCAESCATLKKNLSGHFHMPDILALLKPQLRTWSQDDNGRVRQDISDDFVRRGISAP